MTTDVTHMRRYCAKNPLVSVDLPAWELLELLEALEELRRQKAALQEQLERRHRCVGKCEGRNDAR